MNPYVELARPLNAAMAGFSALLGMLVVLGWDLFDPDLAAPVALGMLVPFFVTAGGNALNDYMDHLVDREAHPGRPLPSGRLTATGVLSFGVGCLCVGLVLSALVVTLADVGLLPVLVAVLAVTALLSYEAAFKYGGLPGNLTVAFLSALTFVFGASVLAEPDHGAWPTVLVLFALALFASLGRELAKDMEDVGADEWQRRTYPMTAGRGAASGLAIGSILVAVVLSPLPHWPLGTMGWPYLAVVLVSDVVFLYSLPLVPESPGRAQRVHKAGMLLALMAFLVGSLAGGIA